MTTTKTEPRGPMDQYAAHLDRGWDLISRGDFQNALVSAQKGLELDRESPEFHHLLGFIRAAEGNAEEALEHYRQALDADDSFVEAMLSAAEVMIHPMGDYDSALRMVDEALDYLEDVDELADAKLLKIDALLHRGDKEAATRVLSTLPEGPFQNSAIEFMIGRARFELGDPVGACPYLERSAEREPDNPDGHYYLALARESLGDIRGATVSFLRTREIEVGAPAPQWMLEADQFERRVRATIQRLPQPMREALEGALVVIGDVPGMEVVADGVDPRSPALIDPAPGRGAGDDARVARLFVYQRNVQRAAATMLEVEEEIADSIERELAHVFPLFVEALTKADGAENSS